MRRIRHWIKKNYLFLLPVLPIIIFIISIWNNNYDIGGDTSVPLNPHNNIDKSLYVWELVNRGMSTWRYMLILWQLPFYFFSLLGIPAYAGIKIYIVSILIIGFVFTYLFFTTLFKNTKYENKSLGIFCGLIFILSGSVVDIIPTFFFLSALPLCSYFVIKYLDTNKIRYVIFFSLAINYSYFAHLPQAKYLFVFLGFLFFILLLYKQLRNISIKNIILKLISLSIFTFLLNAFTLIPFLYEAFKSGGTYSYYTQNVDVLNGDAELHTATLPYITRFFTSSLLSGSGSLARFLASRLFTIWTFFLWAIAFLSIFFVKSRKDKNIIYLCILGFVSFMFLAKGPNPPFDEVYRFLLFNVPIFKVFRTTSMSVIGGTLFFGIMLTIAVYYLEKKWRKILLIILIIHIIIFAPVYFGVRLITFEEKGHIKKGFSIPQEYYQMGSRLDNMKEDIKVLSLPFDDGYTYKDWPYMGESIMGWITKKPYIHGQILGFPGFTDNLVLQRMSKKEACFWTAVNNIGYILNEKDSRIADFSLSNFNFSGSPVLENSYFKLEKVKPACFLPHIYAGADAFLFEGDNNSMPDVSRFTKNKQDIVIGLDSPINRNKDLHAVSQIIIEARPDEISKLSDNAITKKVYSDLSNMGPLNFWTYLFNAPTGGKYQMIIDDMGLIIKEAKDLKKGNNTVKIPISRSRNLIDNNLLNIFINDKNAATFSQTLKDWQGDNLYLLSLKAKADMPGKILLTLNEVERRFIKNPPYVDLNFTLFSQEISQPNPGIYEYQAILKTEINAQEASVTLKKLSGEMTIESFKIEKVTPPKVFFTSLKEEKKIIHQLSFLKINPTKYAVDVKNATEAYHLVFSESFSPDWKTYVQQGGTSGNIFREWFQAPIAEDRHLVVNGFANGWRITPEDSRGKTNYTLIIEYWPQRLFYFGAIISFLTLIVLGCFNLKKRHQKL